MNIFVITFEAVFILIGIGLLGFLILMRRLLPHDVIHVLTPLAIDIAVPCLVFSSIMKSFTPSASPGWYLLPLWWAGFTLIAFCLSMLLSYGVNNKFRGEFRISLLYHNAIFIPLGIITGVYGVDSAYLSDLFLFTLLYPAFFFNTYHLFLGRETAVKKFSIQWSMLRNPILLATLTAIALKLSGASVLIPDVLIKITSVISAMALPLIILIIGGSIYIDLQKKEPFRIREILFFVIAKNFIFPAVILGLISMIKPSYNIALILTLAAAVPPITAVPIVTEKAGGNRGVANQMMTASFITALVSVPLTMWIFSILYSF